MKLSEDLELIHYIFSNMDDAVCVTEKHGILKYANPAAVSLLGLSANTGEDTRIWDAIPFVETNDKLIELFIQTIQAREPARQMLVPYENMEGRRFQFRVSMNYKKEEGGRFVIVISNLTDLIKVTNAFSRYTSPQIADYVLHDPNGQKSGGENREVTVLMSDLRGFTAMSSAMPGDRLVLMLNHYFQHMVSVIERFCGCIIEFLGDGIFVVFGAPHEDPDHAAHAVSCAIEMQNAMPVVNEWNQANGFPLLTMGIGISTGVTVVGNIGSSKKMKYGCVGESVNMAGRVEAQTVDSQILITDSTAAKIRPLLEVRGKQMFMPKGAREPIPVYDVVGIGQTRCLFQNDEPVKWQVLEEPAAVSYFLLNEKKAVSSVSSPAAITALSSDNSKLRMTAEQLPGKRASIMIDIGGNLYGKVTALEKGTAVVSLTSRPENFDLWVKALRKAPSH